MRKRRIGNLYAYQGNVPAFHSFSPARAVRNIKRTMLAMTAMSLTVVLAACGPDITLLRTGIAAVQPAVEYAIQKGVISQARAQLYRDDASKLLNGYEALTVAWKAAGSKAAKLSAVQTFANSTLAPIAGDFTKVPQLAEAMLILNTTISVLEAFYGGAAPSLTAGRPRLASEADVKTYLKEQNAKLTAALAH